MLSRWCTRWTCNCELLCSASLPWVSLVVIAHPFKLLSPTRTTPHLLSPSPCHPEAKELQQLPRSTVDYSLDVHRDPRCPDPAAPALPGARLASPMHVGHSEPPAISASCDDCDVFVDGSSKDALTSSFPESSDASGPAARPQLGAGRARAQLCLSPTWLLRLSRIPVPEIAAIANQARRQALEFVKLHPQGVFEESAVIEEGAGPGSARDADEEVARLFSRFFYVAWSTCKTVAHSAELRPCAEESLG